MEALTHHMIDDVAPQDEAMDQFRKLFPLIAGCNVSEDGMIMTYQLKTLSGAANSLNDAERIINGNNLPLKAALKARYSTGKELQGVELRIVYQPK